MKKVRILIVDDFAAFREFVALMLKEIPEFEIVGTAEDGMQAVHEASTLKPDLILLDINLPKLNGIEAARRIRTLSPRSRVLFVTQESSSAIIEEAFRAGGSGYLLKANAFDALVPAIHTIGFEGRSAEPGPATTTPPTQAVKRNKDGTFDVM